MSIHTNSFKGFAQEGIAFSNEQGGTALFYKIKEIVEQGIASQGIPATIREDVVKSGGFFGNTCPILIVTHSDYSCRYFSIGIYVNGTQVSFPLLGESAENTKRNKKKMYQENGNFIMAAMTNPDEFKLQQEAEWQYRVLDCFNSAIN